MPWTQAFDVVSFSEAAERHCIALRDENSELIVILSDPFNVGLQTWLEQYIPTRILLGFSASC